MLARELDARPRAAEAREARVERGLDAAGREAPRVRRELRADREAVVGVARAAALAEQLLRAPLERARAVAVAWFARVARFRCLMLP